MIQARDICGFGRPTAEEKSTAPKSSLHKAVTQILNIAIGSVYNKDIDTELRPDRQAANVVGQEQFPDQSGINRFLRRFTPLELEDLPSAYW